MRAYQRREQQNRDAQAAAYETWYVENKGKPFDHRERDLFAQAVSAILAGRLLDLGSGTGRIASAISTAALPDRSVVALDLSIASLEICAQKGLPSLSTVQASGTDLPFHAGSFDAVVSCQVLQHMQFDELVATCREVNRVLKPGGCFAASVYNLHCFRYRGIFEEGGPDSLYSRRFSATYVDHLARKTKFSVESISYYKNLPLRPWNARWWETIDRLVASLPVVNRLVSGYMFVVLRKNE